MTSPRTAGERFIAAGEFMGMREVAQTLRTRLGDRTAKVPARTLSSRRVRPAVNVLPEMKQLAPMLGRRHVYRSDQAQRMLDSPPRPAVQTIVDCAESLLAERNPAGRRPRAGASAGYAGMGVPKRTTAKMRQVRPSRCVGGGRRMKAVFLTIALALAACACAIGRDGPVRDAPGWPERVTFPTQDGGRVVADRYGHGDRGVVLAHGGRFDKESWQKQAQILAQAGFRVLAIDFRGHGQSRGGKRTDPDDEDTRFDVLAAIRYLRATGASTVSVVGASFGGGAAAEASVEAEPGEIDRLVLLAHAAIEKPERMKGRKLFIVSRDDFSGDAKIPRLPAIRDQYDRAPGPKALVVLEGSAHAQALFETDQGERLMREILAFLTAP
ncbi:alpha/beta hydrolase [Dokdonella koreensis]|uniref:NADPH-dependent methylglyoxal reductase n=1 Tax=Dokdonella koreensis DS-123 TaxID=1300342 RepID=A0A160DUR1_9GAMM|nr:alpha/beta fold hydrolase [Dokdonella koreensis]ANB18209.1 NADPH-dependent methylglyoxal reductase [Dokdonella koreensis DS-123]